MAKHRKKWRRDPSSKLACLEGFREKESCRMQIDHVSAWLKLIAINVPPPEQTKACSVSIVTPKILYTSHPGSCSLVLYLSIKFLSFWDILQCDLLHHAWHTLPKVPKKPLCLFSKSHMPVFICAALGSHSFLSHDHMHLSPVTAICLWETPWIRQKEASGSKALGTSSQILPGIGRKMVLWKENTDPTETRRIQHLGLEGCLRGAEACGRELDVLQEEGEPSIAGHFQLSGRSLQSRVSYFRREGIAQFCCVGYTGPQLQGWKFLWEQPTIWGLRGSLRCPVIHSRWLPLFCHT